VAESRKVVAQNMVESLRRAEFLNLDLPVSKLADSLTGIDEVAGYVLLWEKYVLVVADIQDVAGNPVVK
jgi:hypothetical protein